MVVPWTCRRCALQLLRKPQQPRFRSSAANASISSALLNRARSMAAEQAALSASLGEGFDSKAAKRIGELSAATRALQRWEDAEKAMLELRSLLDDPKTDPELRSLATEDVTTTAEELSSASHALTSSLVPQHPFAHMPCLLEIRPGAGGGEAALFAGDLFRMYQAFCARSGFKVVLLKYEGADDMADSRGSEAGLHEVVLEIDSPGAYGALRCEAGVHRVQRVPATEIKGRTHTSAASVLVLPSLPTTAAEDHGEEGWDDPSSDYYINPKDVRTDIMRARGAGGQHVNTTDSAVRLTHLPTSTVVSIQDSRSQVKNREKAWRLLRGKLAQARREAREEEMVRMRRSVVGVARMGRGDKVRTYNWNQQRVTDHRSGLSVHNLNDVVQGGLGLEKIMQSVRSWLEDRDLEALMDDTGGGHHTGRG